MRAKVAADQREYERLADLYAHVGNFTIASLYLRAALSQQRLRHSTIHISSEGVEHGRLTPLAEG